MYEETKEFVNKAFEVGKLLFGLDPKKYSELCNEICKIPKPEIDFDEMPQEEVSNILHDYFLEQYRLAAQRVGLDEKYGVAMLEYTALHKEANDCE